MLAVNETANRAADIVGVVARAQAGDQEAFEALYEAFADALFRYVYARCGDASIAEELTGDVWVRVVERLPSFRLQGDNPAAALTAWLYRIAKNLLIDRFRRRSDMHLSGMMPVSEMEAQLDEPIMAREEVNELRRAIENLNPEQREVIVLRFFEERSGAEIARLTGRSEGAVRVMQHRALSALAKGLNVRRGRTGR